jgi:hypothetical protein
MAQPLLTTSLGHDLLKIAAQPARSCSVSDGPSAADSMLTVSFPPLGSANLHATGLLRPGRADCLNCV